jgi:UDP:flavonoid glycosyltransferase YjiC (YdhE family)
MVENLIPPSQRPVLLFACHPLTGHFTPVIKIARDLHDRGWQVSFLGSTSFRARIEASGVEFFPLKGEADLDDGKLFDKSLAAPGIPTQLSAPLVTDNGHQAINALPAAWNSFKDAMVDLSSREPKRQIVILCEAFFYGILPLFFGAALPQGVQAPRTICISITAPAIRSVDLPPFGFPARFDQSDMGRTANATFWTEWEDEARPVTEFLDRKLFEAESVQGIGDVFMSGANYKYHDAILQIGLPSFEYPRVDFPAAFKVVGIIPSARLTEKPALSFWDDLITNAKLDDADASKKKVVVVAQGTVETDPTDLILPTLRSLEHRPDVLAVAILGSRGATLPSRATCPQNARVVDYLNYDAVLQFADLWIHNGGYGAVTHGIAHGVPMIVAGDTQDKPENAKRVEWSGLGIDLGCSRPPAEQLRRAIDQVLSDGSFARVAKRMKKQAQEMDCFAAIENEILLMIQDKGPEPITNVPKPQSGLETSSPVRTRLEEGNYQGQPNLQAN